MTLIYRLYLLILYGDNNRISDLSRIGIVSLLGLPNSHLLAQQYAFVQNQYVGNCNFTNV